jgi:hypothetical protein
VAEPRQPLTALTALTDEALAGFLRDLGASLAFPPADAEPGRPDLAARARARIVAGEAGSGAAGARGGGRRFWFGLRPMRRGLVLAIAALLILAAIVGAVGLGLPGLRIIFGDVPSPGPVASPSSLGPLGSQLGIGSPLPLADVERLAGLDLILPPDPAIGPPDVAYLAGERANLVWAGRPGLPATGEHGVGLLISEFNGHVDAGYYQKILGMETTVTPVTIDGSPGYWIGGRPHFFYYVDPTGRFVDDSHREVGDVLIWSTSKVTYRLESGLDMAGAIRLAESLN